ncbi:protein phosphatase [Abyssibius alkaniclasticus]|uniref:phosphatase domain-containing putative toxin n=1 Tax=Abyssibius alkaniclasticus TaxID=2881234 RepID=UPI0023633F2A|nr:protein phosphatase [Abyssibius alkaniclasticus]UPH71079.1 protein phosphatase [Abyssibius alkaniclasticus]
MTFAIAELAAPKGGRLGICPLPGRFGAALDDMAVLRAWRPDIVVSMTELAEMERHNMADMGGLLAQHGVAWAHFPVRDFGTPAFGAAWDGLSARLHDVLDGGGRVLAHCYGGQGRSGMVLLRLMVERAMQADTALAALRNIRPGAVETDAQFLWASCISSSES